MADFVLPGAVADAGRLCLDCGLCCNGVLFDQVRLMPGDHAKGLTARGLKIKKSQWFNQPCTALCGSLCQLYRDRPTRCREFSCRQFQGVAAGEIRFEAAVERIAGVREQVRRVEDLLARCGAENERKPLAQRYATALEKSPEGVAASGLEAAMGLLRGELEEGFRIC